jgi:SAM-dependent methyltransferase
VTSSFAAGEERWRAHLGALRQVVRQEALLLARRGHLVTGLDSSATLLGDFRAALAAQPALVRARIQLVQGESADGFAADSFDAVLCQGVLMYLPDPGPLLDTIARVVKPGGLAARSRPGGPTRTGGSPRCCT